MLFLTLGEGLWGRVARRSARVAGNEKGLAHFCSVGIFAFTFPPSCRGHSLWRSGVAYRRSDLTTVAVHNHGGLDDASVLVGVELGQ